MATCMITVQQGGTIDNIIGKASDGNAIDSKGDDQVDLVVADKVVHLLVLEEIDVSNQRKAEHEEAENDHLGPREAVNLHLHHYSIASRFEYSEVNLGAHEGGNVFSTDGIVQVVLVSRIKLEVTPSDNILRSSPSVHSKEDM